MNKFRTRRAAITTAVLALAILLGLALRSTPAGQTVITYVSSYVAPVFSPSPSPSPVVAHDAASDLLAASPTPVVTIVVTPSAAPTAPPIESFPAPPPPVAVPVGQPTLAPIPTTMVNVGVASVSPAVPGLGDPSSVSVVPVGTTIVWTACFQGGFTGSKVELCGTANTDPGLTFTWSDGHVGSTNPVTYSTPGKSVVTVSVTETYNGHIYGAGSGNGVPITVT